MTFDGKYQDWNQKRIKGILDFYGHKFMYYKKILDLGCGYADISGVFYRLGADITAVDARQEHLKIASKKYSGIKTIKADLDKTWPFIGKNFDITLDLDLICHLSDFESHLKCVCAGTNHLILETAVCDSDDPYKSILVPENSNIYDQSINGMGCRPTAAAIERVLIESGMSFRRQDNNRYNSNQYTYDWVSENSENCSLNKRRLWFAIKNNSQIKFAPSTTTISIPPIMQTQMMPPVLQNTSLPVISTGKIGFNNPIPLSEIKIKTALCISGHLRTFETNFQSVKEHILSKLDCDVFIHTWDTLGLNHRSLDVKLHNIQTQALTERIKFLYNPKKIVIESNKIFTVTPLMQKRQIDHRDISGILSMFYKIESCNELKRQYEQENNFTYECVIRFRGDLYLDNKLPISNLTNFNYLHLPVYGNYGGLCDQIAFGGSDIMDKYTSLYSHINEYMEEGAPMHPEKILKYHIDKKQIPYIKDNMKFTIRRSNGLIQDNFLLEKALGFIK